jgi:WD40 repeat protein
MAANTEETLLATVSLDRTCKLFDLASGDLIGELCAFSDIATTVVFSATGRFVVAGSHNGTVKVVEVQSKHHIREASFDFAIVGLFCDFDDDIVIVLADRSVLIWRFVEDELRGPIPNTEEFAKRYVGLCKKQEALQNAQVRAVDFDGLRQSFFFEANVWRIATEGNRFYVGLENGKMLCLEEN